MPHNWASAECARYLRHSLVLEDASDLRSLAGIGAPELAGAEPIQLQNTPTRFRRINLAIEPLDRNAGWRLKYQRASGPAPGKLIVPSKLGRQFQFSTITGAGSRTDRSRVLIDSQARAVGKQSRGPEARNTTRNVSVRWLMAAAAANRCSGMLPDRGHLVASADSWLPQESPGLIGSARGLPHSHGRAGRCEVHE